MITRWPRNDALLQSTVLAPGIAGREERAAAPEGNTVKY